MSVSVIFVFVVHNHDWILFRPVETHVTVVEIESTDELHELFS